MYSEQTQSPLDRQVEASWYTNIFSLETSQIACGFPGEITKFIHFELSNHTDYRICERIYSLFFLLLAETKE